MAAKLFVINHHSHKEIDKPEIERDDPDNEEKTRKEEFCVDHGIHHSTPLL
jgi:hypothetical protein